MKKNKEILFKKKKKRERDLKEVSVNKTSLMLKSVKRDHHSLFFSSM